MRAEAAHGTFYRYFESRFDIFATLTDEFSEALIAESDEAIADVAAPGDSLMAVLDAAMRFYRSNVRFLAVLEQFATIDAPSAAVRLQVRQTFVARISTIIEAMQSDGEADIRLSAMSTAEVLVSMFDRSMYEWHVLGVPSDIAASEAYLSTIWRRALQATAKGEDPR